MALPNKKARLDVVQVADSISCGTFKLPGGVEAASGIMTKIFMYLDVKSLLKVVESSLVKQLCVVFNSLDFVRVRNDALAFDYSGRRRITEMIHNPKQLYLLYKRYKTEFPHGTPFVCACEKGRVDDVNQFLNLHRFHAYIDVGTANARMDVTAMVSERGTDSNGNSSTPLVAAAENKHSNVAEYLVDIIYPDATALEKKYYAEFPEGTPLVCACEKGRVEDVEGMIRGARAAGMDVTAMVSEVGTNSDGYSYTPLMIAALYEHSTIIEILLQCDASPAPTNNYGMNALHWAANNNKTTTTTVQLLLNNMKLEDINHKSTYGYSPLDHCY